MTVIEFGKRDNKINTYIVVLTVVLVVSAVFGIVQYNNLITLRHDVSNNEDMLTQLQVQTAELKNKLSQTTDVVSNQSFIQSSGLVQDKNPTYITSKTVISQATQ
jgi:hypothetical protein